jgi:hypothetical protein
MMKKKVLILSLAVLLVLVVAIALVFIGNPPKTNNGADSTNPTGQTSPIPTESIPIRGSIPADKPALVVKDTKAKAGDKQVEVMIDVVNNPGILGMDFDLYYDDSVMTLKDAKSLLDLEGCVYTPAAYYKSPTTFLWDFQDANWTQDGAVLKLYFDIAEDAPAGKYEIKIMYSYGNIFDADGKGVDLAVKNGNISIS